jgi:hypothetical protein
MLDGGEGFYWRVCLIAATNGIEATFTGTAKKNLPRSTILHKKIVRVVFDRDIIIIR